MTDKNEVLELAKRIYSEQTGFLMDSGYGSDIALEDFSLAFAAALEEKHQARIAMLVDALSGLVDGVIPEINEKGAGGFLLARLSDARTVLFSTQQDADAFLAEVMAKALEDAAEECLILDGDDCDTGFANQYDCSNHLKRLAAELRNSAAQTNPSASEQAAMEVMEWDLNCAEKRKEGGK